MADTVSKPKRPFGRSLTDFENLSEAERKLIACVERGETCVLGDKLPDARTQANAIRPELIRFLALGGDEAAPVHEKGLRVVGAFIGNGTGPLDLEGGEIRGAPCFWKSRFEDDIVLYGAVGTSIRFENCAVSSLKADRIKMTGGIFLNGISSTGELRLIGACIGGNLELDDCKLEGKNVSLICERISVGGTLLFRTDNPPLGIVSFANGTITTLGDQPSSWPKGNYYLDGFTYKHIPASRPIDFLERIDWLEHQHPSICSNSSFSLQPWMQLAKVLRDQGHFRDAAEVEIAREDRLRTADKIVDISSLRQWWHKWGKLTEEGKYVSFFSLAAHWQTLPNLVPYFLHIFYGLASGYGHRPMRIVYLAVFTWLAFAALFDFAASVGHFVPANAAQVNTMKPSCRQQFAQANINWTRCEALLAGYSRFSPLAYSLDLILPVARLGQSNMWTPISDGSWTSLSGWTQRLVWFEEVFGWVAALTLGAIAAGLVKRRDG